MSDVYIFVCLCLSAYVFMHVRCVQNVCVCAHGAYICGYILCMQRYIYNFVRNMNIEHVNKN